VRNTIVELIKAVVAESVVLAVVGLFFFLILSECYSDDCALNSFNSFRAGNKALISVNGFYALIVGVLSRKYTSLNKVTCTTIGFIIYILSAFLYSITANVEVSKFVLIGIKRVDFAVLLIISFVLFYLAFRLILMIALYFDKK
jgi:hypothetical protein